MARLPLTALLCSLLALVPGGCGGPAGPVLLDVEGTLTGPNGKPVADVLIQFFPAGTGAVGSSAVTDAAGHYVLKSDTGAAGAVAGQHKVVLIDNAYTQDDEPDPMKDKRPTKPAQPNRVPRTYSSPATTTLSVTVESGKKVYDLKY